MFVVCDDKIKWKVILQIMREREREREADEMDGIGYSILARTNIKSRDNGEKE